MAVTYVDESDGRIIRYVPFSKLRKDEDDNVIGLLGSAFQLRESEAYLSATWCEYFEGDSHQSLRCGVEAIRSSNLDVKTKARFAVVSSRKLKEAVSQAGKKIRIVHEPEGDNAAHVAVRNWGSLELHVLEMLASDVWCDCFGKADIDELPSSECDVRSER